MKVLKAALDLVLVAYIVFVALLLTTILNDNLIFNISSEAEMLLLYKILTGAGAGLILLKLLIDYLYIASIKHEQHRANLKINELKVDLYEKRQEFRNSSSVQPTAKETTAADIK